MRAVLFFLLASCAFAGGDDGDSSTATPLVGVDGSTDAADRNCNVVLRSLQRNNMNGFSYETNGSSWVWSGVVEISPTAAAEGLTPSIVYHHVGPNPWMSGTVAPIAGDATHFSVRLDHDLVGPGMSATAITNAKIEVVPYLAMPEGGRLFDHNRYADDFANYTMTYPDLAIWRADAVCAAPSSASHANLYFSADYSERREGVITAGGSISILYDVARLPTCRNSQGGNQLWDITAHVTFSPTGQQQAASVRDGAATFTVPTDGAQRVSIYFENTSSTGCHAFDSDYAANYNFDVARPPQWIGDAKTRFSRDTSGDVCENGADVRTGFTFDSWVRQRAAITNLCFDVYQPGLTDRDDPDLWQSLDASIHWRFAGDATWQTMPAQLAGRRGNNARYATSLRSIDPYRWPECVHATSKLFEYYLVVNGGEVRPAPGAAFAGVFSGEACQP